MEICRICLNSTRPTCPLEEYADQLKWIMPNLPYSYMKAPSGVYTKYKVYSETSAGETSCKICTTCASSVVIAYQLQMNYMKTEQRIAQLISRVKPSTVELSFLLKYEETNQEPRILCDEDVVIYHPWIQHVDDRVDSVIKANSYSSTVPAKNRKLSTDPTTLESPNGARFALKSVNPSTFGGESIVVSEEQLQEILAGKAVFPGNIFKTKKDPVQEVNLSENCISKSVTTINRGSRIRISGIVANQKLDNSCQSMCKIEKSNFNPRELNVNPIKFNSNSRKLGANSGRLSANPVSQQLPKLITKSVKLSAFGNKSTMVSEELHQSILSSKAVLPGNIFIVKEDPLQEFSVTESNVLNAVENKNVTKAYTKVSGVYRMETNETSNNIRESLDATENNNNGASSIRISAVFGGVTNDIDKIMIPGTTYGKEELKQFTEDIEEQIETFPIAKVPLIVYTVHSSNNVSNNTVDVSSGVDIKAEESGSLLYTDGALNVDISSKSLSSPVGEVIELLNSDVDDDPLDVPDYVDMKLLNKRALPGGAMKRLGKSIRQSRRSKRKKTK